MCSVRNVYILTQTTFVTSHLVRGQACQQGRRYAVATLYSKHKRHKHSWNGATGCRFFHTSCHRRGMDISSVELAGHCSKYQPNWDLHECQFTSNVGKAAPNGIDFLVRYIDTAASLPAEERDAMPVVLATHGSPGSYKDLVLVIEPLIDKGARLILPNMPGFDYTQYKHKDDLFRFTHTTEERLDFLEHFLQAINVSQVDFVCGHSAGCYPITVLSSKTPSVKAAALVSPAPGHTYPRAAEPWALTCSVDWLVRNRITRAFGLFVLQTIGPAVSGIPAKNTAHMLAVLQNATGINFKLVSAAADNLAARNFPLVFFYCEKDPIVWSHTSKDYAARYNITADRTDTFTEDATLVTRGEADPVTGSKAVRFLKRSHYPQKDPRLLDVIKQEVVRLYMHAIGEH